VAEEKKIVFSQQEIQQIQAILIDQDAAEALKFLREVLWSRLQEKQSQACGPLSI